MSQLALQDPVKRSCPGFHRDLNQVKTPYSGAFAADNPWTRPRIIHHKHDAITFKRGLGAVGRCFCCGGVITLPSAEAEPRFY